MAKYRFRGALNAAMFPLVSRFQSRTVIQPQLDNNVRTTQAFYGTSESADYSIPQLLYCENVVPTAEGIMSVGYIDTIPALEGVTSFDQAITLRDADENNFLFSPSSGANYIFKRTLGTWESTDPITTTDAPVSRAYVNGRTFVCYGGIGIFEYDTATDTFAKLTLTGIDELDIITIGSSNNYLIAATTDLEVHWSSLIDPTDFLPSINTGAGFLVPQDVKAQITAVVGTAGGFIVYTVKNAVAAVYTNNIRAPFAFKEIADAGGVNSYEQVTSDQTSGPQYIWGTGGLQKVTLQGSESVSAEVSDFLSGRVWEYWDSVSKTLIEQYLSETEFKVKLVYIASRYLIISYSVDASTTFQYALIFDTKLKRWGKAKVDHVDCFAYPYSEYLGDLTYDELEGLEYSDLGGTSYDELATGVYSNPPSKRTVAFLSANGAVQVLVMDYNKEVSEPGVAIFGKFQLIRARMMGLQQLDLEGGYMDTVSGTPRTRITAIASLDGFNIDQQQPMRLLKSNGLSQTYAKRLIGTNIWIAIEDTFALSSYLLETTNEGDR